MLGVGLCSEGATMQTNGFSRGDAGKAQELLNPTSMADRKSGTASNTIGHLPAND